MFLAVYNSIERLKLKGVVDIFQTTRALRLQRTAMVQTVVSILCINQQCVVLCKLNYIVLLSHLYQQLRHVISTVVMHCLIFLIQDQYVFCYKALRDYLDSFDLSADAKC